MLCRMNAPASRRALFALATSEQFERAVRATRLGERAAWRLARRYVCGPEVNDALDSARRLAAAGIAASIDLFGERVADPAEADRVADRYVELAARLADAPAGTWLSLDLSHLALAADREGARGRLERIAAALPEGARLQIGAEEAALADAIIDTILAADRRERITATVQANLRRSAGDAERLAAAGVAIRLVKGAYVEAESMAMPYGEPTDLAYLGLARRLAELGVETFLATHDAVLREACRLVLPNAPVEMLLGVRPGMARALADAGVPVRVYMPFGPEWLRYAMRRLAESRGR
jgi:proline dehydrogenase